MKIFINDFPIEAKNVNKENSDRLKISFKFTVTHEDYHDVTTLLYKNDFIVKIPEENLEFPATISNYSTSVTNLYKEGSEGEFSLELMEKKRC
ncbi:DUF3219 family protein [Pseudogracilibacillus sp. SO30301A]|uniref:DUF3219 family protein n=1 Tax=Pseudogracilibacillus sp. SO30301A TaxID=3098291 RepID=UPI00300DDF50